MGFYAPPPEPVTYFRLQTYDFWLPTVNFLNMKHGETARVRLGTTICTTERHNFHMNYSVDPGQLSGVVEVAAFNDADNTKLATRWEIYPVPGTADSADFWKQGESGRNPVRYSFGSAPMRFLLTLQKH